MVMFNSKLLVITRGYQPSFPMVMTNSLLLNMTIEIVGFSHDFPQTWRIFPWLFPPQDVGRKHLGLRSPPFGPRGVHPSAGIRLALAPGGLVLPGALAAQVLDLATWSTWC